MGQGGIGEGGRVRGGGSIRGGHSVGGGGRTGEEAALEVAVVTVPHRWEVRRSVLTTFHSFHVEIQ